MNNHFYIPQTGQLKKVIRSIWEVNNTTVYKNEVIIPKGVIEIIFDLGGNMPVESNIDNKKFQLSKCFINGFNTAPIQLQLPKKQFFFGVQFHPVAIKQLFGAPASEFTNHLIDLTLLDRSFHSVWQQLAEKRTFEERVNTISAWIGNKIISSYPQELLLNSFLENNKQHTMSVKELAGTLCYSARHLSRKIHELTGMNTEQVLLYKKYLHAVSLVHNSDLSLTQISYNSNFADQSHFIRCFKTFANITPSEYRQNKSNVQGHIYKNAR